MDSPPKKSLLLTLLSPKVGLPLFAALVVLFGPFVYRSAQLAGLPDPGDPFDVEAFGTVEIEPEDNAYVEYRAAQALFKPPTLDFVEDLDETIDAGWHVAPPIIRQWVDENRPALQVWRKGTEKSDALYHQPRDVTVETILDVTQELRNFARLSRLEASRLAEEGDVAEAWQWHRATFRSSRHSGRHACIIDRLVGVAMHAIVSQGILDWSQNSGVNEQQLSNALREITQDYKMTEAQSTGWKVEYLSILKLVESRDALDWVSTTQLVDAFDGRPALFLKNEPEYSVRILRHIYANYLAEVDRPVRDRTKRLGGRLHLFEPRRTSPANSAKLPPDEIEAACEGSILAKGVVPASRKVDQAYCREQGRQEALRVSLAAQIYTRRHGSLPDNPQQLIDAGILDKWPTDPNSPTGAALNYRRDGDEAVIWSVGKDGTDDGGTVQVDEGDAPDVGFQIRAPGALASSSSQ